MSFGRGLSVRGIARNEPEDRGRDLSVGAGHGPVEFHGPWSAGRRTLDCGDGLPIVPGAGADGGGLGQEVLRFIHLRLATQQVAEPLERGVGPLERFLRAAPSQVEVAELYPNLAEHHRVVDVSRPLAAQLLRDCQRRAAGGLRLIEAASPLVQAAELIGEFDQIGSVLRDLWVLAGQPLLVKKGRAVGRLRLIESAGIQVDEAQVRPGAGELMPVSRDVRVLADQLLSDR